MFQVISAEKGELERKIETGWDTFELAKSMGLSKLVVAVDEMDDPTLKWSKERYLHQNCELLIFMSSLVLPFNFVQVR